MGEKEPERVILWVDRDFQRTLKSAGPEVMNYIEVQNMKLLTLNRISEVKAYFHHLFLIRYNQRTKRYIDKYVLLM